MIMSELATFPHAVAQTLRTRSATYLRLAADRLWHLDFVLIALGALFVGLYLFSADQAFSTSRYVAGELAHIGPWLAASVFIAAAAKTTGADSLATRAFRGRQSRMVVVASLIGALLPFCSCGVIPLVAGLLGAGVPLAPVMAFWISSPLMDPTHLCRDQRHGCPACWRRLGPSLDRARPALAGGQGRGFTRTPSLRKEVSA
jgi:hypothetical protein